MDAKLEKLLVQHWQTKILPALAPPGAEALATIWACRVSPPFPSGWPLGLTTRLRYYGYAEGLDRERKLAEGVRISVPWGCASRRLLAPRWDRLEFAEKELTVLGIQGTRPPHARELELRKVGEALENHLRALGPFPPRKVLFDRDTLMTMVRDYYFFWTSTQEVLTPFIRQRHAAFFDWLLDIKLK